MPDHLHVLVGLKPAICISDLVIDIKKNSTNFINQNDWLKNKFSWREGYGAFSYSESNYGRVTDYIKIKSNITGDERSVMSICHF